MYKRQEIDRITEIDTLTGEGKLQLGHLAVFPASHYVVPKEKLQLATENILEELKERVAYFKSEDKLLEAQRISERTNFDVEMMREDVYKRQVVSTASPDHIPRMTVFDLLLGISFGNGDDAPDPQPVAKDLDCLCDPLADAYSLPQRADDLMRVGFFQFVICLLYTSCGCRGCWDISSNRGRIGKTVRKM